MRFRLSQHVAHVSQCAESVEDEAERRGERPPASVLIFALWKTRQRRESAHEAGGGAGKTNGEKSGGFGGEKRNKTPGVLRDQAG